MHWSCPELKAGVGSAWSIIGIEESCCLSSSLVALLRRMNKAVINNYTDPKEIKAEVRQLRRTGKRIAASRTTALRFLAATGMYTLKGELKPQFR